MTPKPWALKISRATGDLRNSGNCAAGSLCEAAVIANG
jgi:hypothetical protein